MQINNPFLTFSINCCGTLLHLDTPIIMGILNLSADSFYSNNSKIDIKNCIQKTKSMLQDGATIIDIGAVSSKPGATYISIEEELQLLRNIAKEVIEQFPTTLFSIDTCRAEVAAFAHDIGFKIINDISGGTHDATMFTTAAKRKMPVIIMHKQGTPDTMQNNPNYNDVVLEVAEFFIQQTNKALSEGVFDVVLDVGFGFGKTLEHNYKLVNNISYFHQLNYPLLAGISRKSMLHQPLSISPNEALNATTFVHSKLLDRGVQIYRVHDVKAMKEAIILQQLIYKNT